MYGGLRIYIHTQKKYIEETNKRPLVTPWQIKRKNSNERYQVSGTSSKSTPSSSPSVSPSSSVPPQSANLPLTGTRLGMPGTGTTPTTNGNTFSTSRRAFRRGAGAWAGAWAGASGGGGRSSSPMKSTRPSRIMLFFGGGCC